MSDTVNDETQQKIEEVNAKLGIGSNGGGTPPPPSLFAELVEWEPDRETSEVKIGDKTFIIQGITDPTTLLKIQREAEDREGKPVALKGNKKCKPDLREVKAYLFLRDGLIVPEGKTRPSYDDIVRISRKTIFECLNAGIEVMRLSGLVPENITQLKNE